MTDSSREQEIRWALDDLHTLYLKDNEFDEGDPIFYRINYRLEETFGLTRQEAAHIHRLYHETHPRHISKGFCEKCDKVVGIIPIIYGIQESDMEKMKESESESLLIIGNLTSMTSGKIAMFGCKICKNHLPKYGVL